MLTLKEPTHAEDYVYLNLDYDNVKDPEAQAMLDLCREYKIGVKLGTDLTAHSSWFEMLNQTNLYQLPTFADTKANDIPNTVQGTLATIFRVHPEIINIHASAGEEALAKFLELRQKEQSARIARGMGSLAIGVTTLTSKTDQEIRREFNGRTRKQQSLYYAHLLDDFGFDGLTCSGNELKMFRRDHRTRDMTKIVLGVRPEWAERDDHAYVIEPAEAVRLGARVIGVGRPITSPPAQIGSPNFAIESILEEVDRALPNAA